MLNIHLCKRISSHKHCCVRVCGPWRVEKCVHVCVQLFSYALNVLLNVFFALKVPNYEGTKLCATELNVKFALGQTVPDSFSNRIVGFILGQTWAKDRSTHLCRETGKNTNFSKAFRRLAVKV